MKFSIKDFFSKCEQTRSKLRIWSHLLKKFLNENFIFLCSVKAVNARISSTVNHKETFLLAAGRIAKFGSSSNHRRNTLMAPI